MLLPVSPTLFVLTVPGIPNNPFVSVVSIGKTSHDVRYILFAIPGTCLAVSINRWATAVTEISSQLSSDPREA